MHKRFIPKDMINYAVRMRKSGINGKNNTKPRKKNKKDHSVQPRKRPVNSTEYSRAVIINDKIVEQKKKNTKEEEQATQFKPDRECWLVKSLGSDKLECMY